ncbi:tripartite tricarboxylate transporter TctB family protein [Poseidonocella sp. HB161398]|uniref:tripartite tricarboxylate transporter TctB family protein n=1 Tax=Poseidonocella sp. HB161398 TaxID=2320855 RepID=UPI001109744E|nr:tripartite tricarboxylate transporter TctB family protein [Poseidonocella sp. HB161398]
MQIKDSGSALAGAGMIAFGAVFLWAGRDLSMGSLQRMGPGYFPALVAGLSLLLGAVLLAVSLRPGEGVMRIGRRGAVVIGAVAAAILVFGHGIGLFGMVPSAFAATYLVTLSQPEAGRRQRLALSAVSAGVIWGIFLAALGLQAPAFAWPF